MICNSSPLIFLAKINKINLLKNLFKKITISEDVKKEVLIKEKPGFNVINEAINEGWIKIKNPKNNPSLKVGKGENSAINLARENKDKLIIDDGLGTRVAKLFNIETLRTTTIIFMSIKRKIITKKEGIKLINSLIDEGYYIAPKYYVRILEKLFK